MILFPYDPEEVFLLADGDLPHGLLQAGRVRRRGGIRGLDHVPVEGGPPERPLTASEVQGQDLKMKAVFSKEQPFNTGFIFGHFFGGFKDFAPHLNNATDDPGY